MLRCQVAGVAAVEAETRHSFPRHTHGQFGIGVIDRGAQKSLSGRGTVEAVAGDTINVNPGEVHDGVPIGDAGRSWRMESGLSRFQVLRGFVRATGFTPHAYLVQRRIDLARRLIAGGTPLAQAAAASGFADQSHMTRVFVRTYGVSPGVYACAVA